MEKLINTDHYREVSFQVLGKEYQALQLVLMPGQKIVTAANSVQYMSGTVRLRDKYSIRERFKQFFTGSRRLDCIADNQDGVGFIGVTQNRGRIVVVEPGEESYFVREEYVLAHTANIEIVINNKFSGANLMKQPFFKVITRRQMPQMFEDFLKSNAIIPLDQPTVTDDSEMLFIHAHDSLVEKTLGEEEVIVVNKASLACFSGTLQIQTDRALGKEFLRIKGPGHLYIETSRDQVMSLAGVLLEPQDLTR